MRGLDGARAAAGACTAGDVRHHRGLAAHRLVGAAGAGRAHIVQPMIPGPPRDLGRAHVDRPCPVPRLALHDLAPGIEQRRLAERLAATFQQRKLPFPLFVQGDGGRSELLRRFRATVNGVLIGSQSFWEGGDMGGDALALVIIDKLPFAPPDDPVLAARMERMERQGHNSFIEHCLSEAIINLKQGAGRLFHDESNQGVLMIFDARMIVKPYGRRIWQSLPSFRRTHVPAEVVAFLQRIAHRPPASPWRTIIRWHPGLAMQAATALVRLVYLGAARGEHDHVTT